MSPSRDSGFQNNMKIYAASLVGGGNLQFSVEKGVKGVEILLEEPVTIHKEETLEVWFDR